MFRAVICALFLCTGCGAQPQPDSIRTVAAFEVPLPTLKDKADFLALLTRAAEVEGYHVDAASLGELRQLSQVSPITFNATVWRGNDEEVVASAMDFQTHLGRIWLSFSKGNDQKRFERFRRLLMPQIRARWPAVVSLPIMPTGAIPLDDDLVRTPSGYRVKPAAAAKYQR
jgi:hypothetical protein